MSITLKDIYSIKVIGVGEAGSHAINQMINLGITGVEFCTVDTGNDSSGIREYLNGTDFLFLFAGMGGRTGDTVPFIAQIARELGIFTLGIVIKPFSFQTKHRMLEAEKGIAGLKKIVDNMLVISGSRIPQATDKASAAETLQSISDVLTQIIRGISDLNAIPKLINIDLMKDVKPVLKGKALYIGAGAGFGEKRAVIAAEQAVSNQYIETTLKGAKNVFINITGGTTLSFFEVNEAGNIIIDLADPSAHIGWGTTIDKSMDDKIRITVIASGSGNT